MTDPRYGFHDFEHAGCPRSGSWGAAMRPGPDGELACIACGYRADSPATGFLSDAFDMVHRQYGQRADPHVWGMMRDRLADVPTPADAEAALLAAFTEVTGLDLRAEPRPVYVEALDHGGMTGGFVDTRWWRAKGIPLMVERATRGRVTAGPGEPDEH